MLNTILLGTGMLLFLLFLSRRKASTREQPETTSNQTDAKPIPSDRHVGLRNFERPPELARRGTALLDRR
jgi:hypothetical protein